MIIWARRRLPTIPSGTSAIQYTVHLCAKRGSSRLVTTHPTRPVLESAALDDVSINSCPKLQARAVVLTNYEYAPIRSATVVLKYHWKRSLGFRQIKQYSLAALEFAGEVPRLSTGPRPTPLTSALLVSCVRIYRQRPKPRVQHRDIDTSSNEGSAVCLQSMRS